METVANKNRLCVALVSTQATWHGGEAQAALLASGLRDRGHRCVLLARHHGEFANRMKGQGFEVHTFARRGRSPRALWSLRQLLKTLRPDVLHANDAHALTASGVAGLGLSIPVRVAARRVDFPLRSPSRYRKFSDGLVCVSNTVARICRDSGISAEALHVVHDGVDPQFAESGDRLRGRESLHLRAEDKLLLTVAKLTDHKGHTFLLRAMPEILAQHPRAVLALAGEGELRETLQTEASQLGVDSAVRFLGYRHDIPDLLAAADVVVQPSHMEGLCSSLIDAMLAGRAIVATSAGGIPDLLAVDEGKPPVGWLVPPQSPTALSRAITDALEHPAEAKTRGERARTRALSHFTADHMVAQTLRSYANIAQRRYGHQAASRVPALLDWFGDHWREEAA